LNNQNTTVAIVGRGEKFELFDDEDVSQWLDLLGGEVGSTRARQAKEKEQEKAAADAAEAAAGEDTGAGDAMETD